MIANIFCDFANKEIRRVYGLYGNLHEAEHERVLGRWINLAVLLAPEWCLVPIGFVAESRILQTVLRRKEALMFARVFRLAMRDSEIERFILRRRIDYLPFRHDYPPLYSDDTIGFLQRYTSALQGRTGRTATEIGERWPAAIHGATELSRLRRELDRPRLQEIEQLPDVLANQSLGFTWNAIEERLPQALQNDTAQVLRRFLHADFVRGYLQEYGLQVLTSLPFGWRDLGVQPVGGYYDYEWLAACLQPLGILDLFVDLDALSLLALRAEEGFLEFQELYRQACEKVPTAGQLRRAFTQAATGLSNAKQQLFASVRRSNAHEGPVLNGEEVQTLGFVLAEGARRAAERLEIVASSKLDPFRSAYRIYIEQIDEFAKVRDVLPGDVLNRLKVGRIELSEDAVQLALEEILAVPFHKKDWGGEVNDLYSANLHLNGRRMAAAFLLKGNGLRAVQMHIGDCGKNGDQLLRLIESPSELFVVQYVGPVSEAVIKDMDQKVRALRASSSPASYCIIDGQETARLLKAHGKL